MFTFSIFSKKLDFASTSANTPVKFDVLGNDEGTIGVPLAIGDGLDDVFIGSPGSLFNNAPGKSFVVFGNTAFGGIYRPTSTPADLELIKTSSNTTQI